jgi:molybdopterin/thiamine biosynthesis adenylyltransferase
MVLSDAQIDRFSRQIVLPEVGARGQERLLVSSVAVAGEGALAEIVALHLAGAGIGRIALHGAGREPLRGDIADLNPEVCVALPTEGLGSADADVLLACDVALAELDQAAGSARPLIAGGTDDDGGWLVVSDRPDVCASCAARAATGRRGTACRAPTVPAAGVVAALMALAALKHRLGLGEAGRRLWLQFDVRRSMLSEHPIERAPDCPVCAARR